MRVVVVEFLLPLGLPFFFFGGPVGVSAPTAEFGCDIVCAGLLTLIGDGTGRAVWAWTGVDTGGN